MNVFALPHALKHGLSESDVAYAWKSPIRCRQRAGKDEPPRWIAIGLLPDGRLAELVAIQTIEGDWYVYHAMTPPTKKFLKELEINDGRKR